MHDAPTVKRTKKKTDLLESISATVHPETRKRLLKIAAAEHRTFSQVVRVALEEFLRRKAA